MLARAFLVLAMALGSFCLFTVVPFGWLGLVASLSERYTTIYLFALLSCPVVMLLWGWGLYRINRVYLRLTARVGAGGTWARAHGVGPKRESRPMLLEVFLVASAVIALVILVVWWLLLAHPPTSAPLPSEGGG